MYVCTIPAPGKLDHRLIIILSLYRPTMNSGLCVALVCWGVVWSMVCCPSTATTTTTSITTTQEPDQQDLNATTVMPDDIQKEEGSNRFLGFGGGGNAFGTYDVAASSFVQGSSGYHQQHQHQQAFQGHAAHAGGVLPHPHHHLQSSYHHGFPPGRPYNPYHNTIPGGYGHAGGFGGVLLQPGDSCKYYCLWSTSRAPYCCDSKFHSLRQLIWFSFSNPAKIKYRSLI